MEAGKDENSEEEGEEEEEEEEEKKKEEENRRGQRGSISGRRYLNTPGCHCVSDHLYWRWKTREAGQAEGKRLDLRRKEERYEKEEGRRGEKRAPYKEFLRWPFDVGETKWAEE